MVRNFVDTMYTSWQYTDANSVVHYGLDILNNSSLPAPNFNWQSLIWDGGVRYKTKKGLRIRVNFLPLPTGYTLKGNYTLNRGTQVVADPTSGLAFSASVGDTALTMELNNARFYEIQFGFSGTAIGATTPITITGITLEVDTLEDEVSLRHTTQG